MFAKSSGQEIQKKLLCSNIANVENVNDYIQYGMNLRDLRDYNAVKSTKYKISRLWNEIT